MKTTRYVKGRYGSKINHVNSNAVTFLVNILECKYEPVRDKTNNLGSDQIRHKPACTVTEDGWLEA